MKNKKKDVLFLCQFFYPEYISSATLPYDTAKALSQSGFKVDVLCGYPKEYNLNNKVLKKENRNGIIIKRLKYIQMKRTNVIGRLINYLSFTISVFSRILTLKNYKSVIVYSNPPVLPLVALVAKKLFGTKIVFVGYDIYPEIAIRTSVISEKGTISNLMHFINTLLYKNVSKVVALSDDMKNFIMFNRNSIKENQIEVIPNWFEDKEISDTERSYKNTIFNAFNAKDKLVISYFGNMGIAQDLDTLIEAMKVLKNDSDIIFMFAGHGNKLDFVKQIADQENLINVHIFDFLHGDDYQDALNISDVFVVSLQASLTGLAVPSKTYSYMMAGKPILSIMSKNADISKDISGENAGYSIEVGDVSNLIKAIKTLKTDIDKRILFGKNSRQLFIDKYTTIKATSKYVDLINELLEEN